jgi:hypothetical protein
VQRDRLEGAKYGALVGLGAGTVLAILGEAGAALIRSTAYMADVGIVGFTAVFGTPASVALGALLGWWGRPRHRRWLTVAAAVPAGVVAIAHVALQALSV